MTHCSQSEARNKSINLSYWPSYGEIFYNYNKCTRRKPYDDISLEIFIKNLKHIYEVDKHVHLMEVTYDKFIKKWTP